jgi:hypothetical protein
LAAGTISTILHTGLTGARPPISLAATLLRALMVFAALSLLSTFRRPLERVTLLIAAAAALCTTLYGFGIRSPLLSAARLALHLAAYVLLMLVAARRATRREP